MPRQAHPERPRAYMTAPQLAVGASFALGIALTGPVPSGIRGVTPLLGLAGVSMLLGLAALRGGWLKVSLIAGLTGFAAAGAMASRLFELRFPPDHIRYLRDHGVDLENPVRLRGRVISTPIRIHYGLQFDLAVSGLENQGRDDAATGKVRVRLQTTQDPEMAALADSLHLRYGDAIRALVRLERPRSYRNPGSFNFRQWMESIEDIYWVGTIKSPALVEKLAPAGPGRFSNFTERIRQRVLRGIDSLFPPWSAEGRKGAVLKAVLLGDRSSLDSGTIESFRKTGLFHLLVISGLNVALLAMLAGIFFRFLRLRESASTVLILVLLLGYAFLVEEGAPTLRATLMISTYLIARLLYRQLAALNSVGLAALVLLMVRPPWLFESGFVLSFSAVLLIAGLAVPILERTTEPYRRGLYQLAEVDRDSSLEPLVAQFRIDVRSLIAGLRARFRFWETHPRLAAGVVTVPARTAIWTANMLLFSMILQLGLLLPMAATFHRVAYAGIVLNALAIPAMTLVLGMSVPTVVFSATLPVLAVWPGRALSVIMSGLFKLTDLPGLPTWLSYRVPDPPRWVAWGFALSVVIAAWGLARHARVFWSALAALGVFVALISLHPFPPRVPSGMLEVTALDCGGGHAVFLVLPDRTTMLWGTGAGRGRSYRGGGEGPFRRSRWNPGEDIVSPYLWSRGIKRVDVLVLTSPREANSVGLAALLGNFAVGEIWSGRTARSAAIQELLDQGPRRGVFVREVSAAGPVARGEVSIQILWPPAEESPGLFSDDGSVVMRITYGAEGVLLQGDITGKVEQALTRSGVPLESQVLEVGRHGSDPASSSQFLARVSPRIALLTAESGSMMSSLHSETLERLRAAGARMFRTDLDGAITVEMTRSSLAVYCYRTSPAE